MGANENFPGGLAAFVGELGGIPHTADPSTLVEKSRDYFWFSPILKEELEGLTADLVVSPRTQEEVIKVAGLCAKYRLPITARGMGTGNFGQAVPLAGGVVLDMTGLDRMLWVKGAVARAEGGILVEDFDKACRAQGWEMRMHPSTKRFATLAGYMSGGHAGIGSVNYGILRDRGNILGFKLVTIEETPRVLEIRGEDVSTVHHAYGVNGIILEVELPLAPAHEWRDVIVEFADLPQAARFGWDLAVSDGIGKKLVAPIAGELARHFHAIKSHYAEGAAIAICMVAAHSMEALGGLVAEHGGKIVFDRPEGSYQDTPLYEFTWGHTTLQVLKDDPSVTYLIAIFRGSDPLEQVRAVHEKYRGQVHLHLELKRINGQMAVEGLPVFRYESREQVERIAHQWEEMGVKIANPHTYFLQNGGMHKIDEAQIDFKKATDPHGLMNPGKVAGLDEIDGAPGGAADMRASGWAY
jgi:FAD/FMN-containing dehydrogenase